MGMLEGRRAVIFGVANDHSIAWSIARRFRREGAELALTYPNAAIEKRLRPLAASLDASLVLPCDVARDAEIENVFATLGAEWGELDSVVHSVAFANRDELRGRFIETSRQGFQVAMDISAYSLVAIARHAEALLAKRHGSLVTLTYFGAEKVFPHYNAMGVAKAALEACVRYLAADLGPAGIRVNAISAGPLRTLSAAAVGGFKAMLHHHADRAPLRRNVSADEIGATALYLCSELAASVTGEVVHADAGYNIIGM